MTDGNKNTDNKKAHCRTGKIIIIFTLLLAVIALVVSTLSWSRLNQQNKTQTGYLQTQLRVQKQQMTIALNSLSQNLSAKQEAINNKLAKLGNNFPAQNVLQEVDYLLRLANLNLSLGNDPKSALTLMNLADRRLKEFDDPAQNNIRAAIIMDINKIKSYPKIDVTGILLQLDAIRNQVNTLHPIPNKMPATASKVKASNAIPSTGWSAKWQHALRQLKSLVIIRHRDKPIKPLLSPKRFNFTQDYIDLSIAKAQWAVLHQDDKLYQHALTNAINQLQQMGGLNQYGAMPIIEALTKISQHIITPHYPSILNSLNLVQKAISLPRTLQLLSQPKPMPFHQKGLNRRKIAPNKPSVKSFKKKKSKPLPQRTEKSVEI